MTAFNRPRLVIAGTNSGVGKTTIVVGLLAALRQKGLSVQPFKVGPDYIDPGFHSKAAGRDSYNLDTWMVPEEYLQENFTKLSDGADISIIEGVMGLYDGGANGVSSTADIAKRLKAPIILVLDCKSVGYSIAATALGFREYDKTANIAGVILNKLGSDRHEAMVREVMEKINMPVVGAFHRDSSPDLDIDDDKNAEENHKIVKIGVARDAAFSFYYPSSLEKLESMGAELIDFSPLEDSSIPDVDGLIFGGGFPEIFLEKLQENESMKQSIREAASKGMPIYAECGGLMYLCRQIVDFDGNAFDTAGIIPGVCKMGKNLQRVGYVTATALKDSIAARKGDQLRGHEFHFSMITKDEDYPDAYELQGTRQSTPHLEGYSKDNVLASYLHISFEGNPKAADHFIKSCLSYKKTHL